MKVPEFSGTDLENIFTYWKEQLCNFFFLYFSIATIAVYIPGLFFLIPKGAWNIVILDTTIYLTIIAMTLLKKRISHFTRTIVGIAVCFVEGWVMIARFGSIGVGVMWLFTSILLAGLILGTVAASITLSINILTYGAVSILLYKEVTIWRELHEYTTMSWIVDALNFLVISIMIIIATYTIGRAFYMILKRTFLIRKATIIGLAKLAEFRDNNTGLHLLRIQKYTTILTMSLKENPKFKNIITDEFLEDIKLSSVLHDIGKVGINDSILLKPSKLTEKEFEQIKLHPVLGGDVISEIEKNISGHSFYDVGRDVAYCHHEKWDGSGYPRGLKGEEIPLCARIVAVADVYDAITSQRPYKEAMPHSYALQIIKEGYGIHFDPEVVDALILNENRFMEISKEMPN